MIPIFENVGLIGLGLIGSSLARAIKKNNLANHITGYTKSPESSARALELRIIDKIAMSNTEIAQRCDIIIICTPLSTYENIFLEIAPALQGRNCIITDVGSLKLPVIELAEKYFTPDCLKQLVPAHPIAGTEKTGVESGFAELFETKKTILTPNTNTSKNAIGIVSKLWHCCGSNTQIIEAELHDKIYAEVSHLPQLLAYCYAMLLLDNSKTIPDNATLKNNTAFKRFSRICSSDPTIWYDIFSMNKVNIAASLRKFTAELNHIANNIKAKEPENAEGQIEIYNNALIDSLPAIISDALIKCSPHATQYAGSGFKDFTSASQMHYEATAKSTELTGELSLKINEIIDLINIGDYKNSMEFMQKAANRFS